MIYYSTSPKRRDVYWTRDTKANNELFCWTSCLPIGSADANNYLLEEYSHPGNSYSNDSVCQCEFILCLVDLSRDAIAPIRLLAVT